MAKKVIAISGLQSMRNKEKEPVMLAPFLALWNVHNDIYYLHIMDKTR